jgi:hypothetical protein
LSVGHLRIEHEVDESRHDPTDKRGDDEQPHLAERSPTHD